MNEGREVVAGFFRSFTEGNVQGVFDALADDVEYVVNTRDTITIEALPWSRTFNGKAAVQGFFGQLMAQFEVLEFALEKLIADGPDVAAFGRFRYRARPTGNTCRTDWAARFHVVSGKVQSYQFFEDSYAIARAFRHGGSWDVENDGWRRPLPATD